MNRWLLKSEPETYAIGDLARDRRTAWEGVRNVVARNHLRRMRRGDLAFFYHSSTNPLAIAGTMRVIRAPYPDPAQFDRRSAFHDPRATRAAPRWSCVDVAWTGTFPRPVTRDDLKRHPLLKRMALFSHTRLSVSPVSAAEWRAVVALSRAPSPRSP